MAAQIAITAVKVPAALISGSIAQLSDAIEEILDVIASVTNVSLYSPWISHRKRRVITSRLEMWMLYLVESNQVTVRSDLLGRLGVALSAETNPLLREFGMEFDASALAEPALNELIKRMMIGDMEPMTIAVRGRRVLNRALRRRF
jgi:hypothetical protein